MNSVQYEELCRFSLAKILELDIQKITSTLIPNPQRPNMPEYRHQIDLNWEIENETSKYLNIANAKWRSSTKVEQGEVLLLHQVKTDVDAHKAMMITNTGFTSGAIAVAKDKGISLLIVQPQFEIDKIPNNDRENIISSLLDLQNSDQKPIFSSTIVHKGWNFDTGGLSRPNNLVIQHTNDSFTHVNKSMNTTANKSVNTQGIKTKTFGPFNKK